MNSVVKLTIKDINSIPFQEASLDIWDKKYRLTSKDGQALDRSMDDTYKRVARALADVEDSEHREHWNERFLWALRHGAIPAGRVTSNAGAQEHKPATSTINCTVSGTVHDSMDDILNKVHEAGLTLKAGCVAPGTWVRTERGLVTADQAVHEKHEQILCYDRDARKFEMRRIERHLTTHVPRSENIRIRSNGVTLTTSIRHPVLVHRDGRLSYVRADEVRSSDALVHHRFAWEGDAENWLKAWFAGAHRGDGSAHEQQSAYKGTRKAWAERAQAFGKRLVFKIRAAEHEVVERYAAFFEAFAESRANAVAARTINGATVRDCTVASFRASGAVDLIDRQIGSGSATLRVPQWVSAEPERFFLPFLAGLIDTDGTVSTQFGSAIIAMSNVEFARQLQALLGLFGVHGSITLRKAREHMLGKQLVRDSGDAMLKISDSGFLAEVALYMADSAKRTRIREHASTSGQYDVYQMPAALSAALQEKAATLSHTEKQSLGFYHGYHTRDRISRVWLNKWAVRFADLHEQIAFTMTLRPVDAIERDLDVPETFFDFTVEKHNNYVAGNDGMAVIHNCGIGYEFSTLRPRGAYVSGAGSYTSGPLSFMDIYDKMCFTVSSAGGRRGAQMATFDVSHPDAMDFVRAKRENGRLRQFNLSLLITDEFMQAVREERDWKLAFPVGVREAAEENLDLTDASKFVWREWPTHEGYVTNEAGLVACRIYRTVPARRVWDVIMSSTYDFAEPGFILIDRVNEMNNNWWCENIRATNPCVTADTRLATQFGMVPIGRLYASGAALNVSVDRRALGYDEQGVEVRPAVPAFMTSSSADVYRVITEAGYEIKATEWHEFYTTRGKIKLKDLKAGDELLIQSGKGQFGTEGSADLGMLLGLITGDGHFANRGKGEQAAIVNLWGLDRDYAQNVVSTINAMIAGISERTRDYQVSAVAVPDRNLIMIRSVLLARVLEKYGFSARTKMQVPEVVWRGSEECVKAYLRALFQTDGTVQRDDKNAYCTIRLASSHPSLLKDVQTLLANFGLFSRVLKRREAGRRMLPDGRGGKRLFDCMADYELLIGSQSRDRFMQEIGFLTDAKNHKYAQWREQRTSAASERFVSSITSIEHCGREAVFDTTQADKNNLIFNGIVTGNCGEQPLPPYGSCLLGSVNLTRFVRDPFTPQARFDWDEYREVVRVFTRMLDNVVEVNGLPLAKQRDEITRKRRHGMGFLGLGSTITLLGHKYGSSQSLKFTEDVSREMALAGWEAALELAREKGPAPIMNEEFTVTSEMLRKRPEMVRDGWKLGEKVPGRLLHARYSRYMQRVAEAAPHLVEQLAQVGARFTHHSSIAPTGTISLSLANNASNGIEPSFAHHYFRNVIREGRKTKEKIDVFSFELLAYRELINPRAMPGSTNPAEALPEYFTAADEVTPRQHVDIQAASQKWVDSSISKTANVPTNFPYEEFKGIYMYAHEQGLKGCTTFRFNPEAFQGVLVKEVDLKNTTYVFTLEDGTEIKVSGDEEIEYDGEKHSAANLFDALKEGYYGKL
jgi:ribonucleoside-diphosphate reductase alpha chain